MSSIRELNTAQERHDLDTVSSESAANSKQQRNIIHIDGSPCGMKGNHTQTKDHYKKCPKCSTHCVTIFAETKGRDADGCEFERRLGGEVMGRERERIQCLNNGPRPPEDSMMGERVHSLGDPAETIVQGGLSSPRRPPRKVARVGLVKKDLQYSVAGPGRMLVGGHHEEQDGEGSGSTRRPFSLLRDLMVPSGGQVTNARDRVSHQATEYNPTCTHTLVAVDDVNPNAGLDQMEIEHSSRKGQHRKQGFVDSICTIFADTVRFVTNLCQTGHVVLRNTVANIGQDFVKRGGEEDIVEADIVRWFIDNGGRAMQGMWQTNVFEIHNANAETGGTMKPRNRDRDNLLYEHYAKHKM